LENLTFPTPDVIPGERDLRREVRDFVKVELAGYTPEERSFSWNAYDAGFARKLGQRGWIGMTWPKQYGGHERSSLERYIVTEELLAAGAPLGFCWVADRQSGPLMLRYGTEAQRQRFLPAISAGECSFCIGMSEPDAGSDLSAVRTRATRVDGGYRVNGRKIWTSNAHLSEYLILFCRTADKDPEDRHAGFSQLIVKLDTPGITIRPIHYMNGEHRWNEVTFDDVLIEEGMLVGQECGGWKQLTSELAFERSGPDRILSSFIVVMQMLEVLKGSRDSKVIQAIGKLTSHLVALRALSRSVAGMLQSGESPVLQASVVKDLGTSFEQSVTEIARELLHIEPIRMQGATLATVLADSIMLAPGYSIRGGAREVLRSIIARGLGVR
jgi:alkylation response protein AidB-like acyl-CoA dehydrogenase